MSAPGTKQDVLEANLLSENKELADVLELIANYYIMEREAYRARAFSNASAKIAEHPVKILSGAQARREIATGIGDSIQSAIDEYIRTKEETGTGTIERLKNLENRSGDRKNIIDYFSSFYGIGPVTAVKFYNQGFRTLEDIWFKANLTDAQKLGILWRDHLVLRIPREEMDLINEKLKSMLDKYEIKWNIAGSYRREEPSSGDIDILVESRDDLNMEGLIQILQPILVGTLAQGQTKFMGILRLDDKHNGHRIDIRLINKNSYAAALMYFTGSQHFNILMRQRAMELGMTLNEYGLFYNDGRVPPTINSEEDIFAILRVKYLAPVQRTRTLETLSYI